MNKLILLSLLIIGCKNQLTDSVNCYDAYCEGDGIAYLNDYGECVCE